jgi:TetR/AcrR family transcriptional regulator
LTSRSAPPIDSPRRRSSGEETRAALLAAAERHFAERGFEAARLEDIAADVGIRRAAIFYHFKDKHELYAAVLEAALGDAEAALPSHGSAAERIEGAITGWIDYVARRPTVARLILREAASARQGVTSPLVRAGGASVEWFRQRIDEGVASGELKPLTDPHRFISLMGATTVFHLAAMPSLTPAVPFDPASRTELARHKREMLRVARRMLGIEPRARTR